MRSVRCFTFGIRVMCLVRRMSEQGGYCQEGDLEGWFGFLAGKLGVNFGIFTLYIKLFLLEGSIFVGINIE